ncbi:EamA family transporter RarD [Aquicoccus sp. G2-2]|uniref:EamA family transporter RarD n=1 Tax=Aquicoccus sp. G2-2 TaxID=3092120 RepID=UPI002AE018EB|nr:EamA family transporter RarD [Aquicoccus sp. G2-2]MEA1114548.1 EamA family transporter RarD [Aquicoccus sp. G2-2]
MLDNRDTPQGLAYAIAAYMLWGFLPLYMKAMAHIPATEIVAHRVIWSVPIAGALLVILKRTDSIRAALQSPRTLAMGALTATLVSINWGIYVWAIAKGHTLDAALGYYINPLFSVLLGALLLGERLSRLQIFAIALAACAVVVLTIDNGHLPWVALGLTFSWGCYAFFKKSLPIGPNQGFLLEVLLLTPPALVYLGWIGSTGNAHFSGGWNIALLLGCGVVTAVPLLLYANGAKRLKLSTIGILQYITPTMIMLFGVFAFGEPFGPARMIAFPLIWLALMLYTASMLQQHRAARRATAGL